MPGEILAELRQAKPYGSIRQEAYVAILRTAAVLAHDFEETLKPFGLTGTQYNVLRILRGAGPDGLCRHEIRDRMVTTVPDVTRLLDRLEQAGLITRHRGVADRRQMTTRITEKGLKLLGRVEQPVIRAHDEKLGHLGDREVATLVSLLAKARRTA